jgi:hypothetical protein
MKEKKGEFLQPIKINNVVKSLNVLDFDVTRIKERLVKGRKIRLPSDKEGCFINITCCIIDCSDCVGPDRDIYINPANRVKGFLFKLPEQKENKEAPLFFVPEMKASKAFKMAHTSLNLPGDSVEGRLVGLAGEILSMSELKKQKISPTAPVISLSPVKSRKKLKKNDIHT